MFCPSCGAKNSTGARTCAGCERPLPGLRAPTTQIDEPAATVPDGPAPAPVEPPRILKRPAPLAPPPLDVVPKNPLARATTVGASDPTLVRPPPRPAPVTMPTGAPVREAAAPVTMPLVTKPSGAPVREASVTAPLPLPAVPPLLDEVTIPTPAAALDSVPPPPDPVPAPAPEIAPRAEGRSDPRPSPPAAPADARPEARPEARPQPRPEPRPVARPERPARVERPEMARAASPRVSLAPAGRWLVAGLVDVVVGALLVVGFLVGGLAAAGVRAAPQPVVDFIYASPEAAAALLVGMPVLAIVVVQGVVVAFAGGTPGHRLLGLRVARMATGERPGPLRAVVRGLFVGVGTLACGAGPLWGALLDRRRRGLGDLVARTVVVRAAPPGERGSDAR